ncbi:MAG: hypothetical protein WCR96_06230 [Candidatus Methanomethylophilaceae archaeon]
MLSEDQIQAFRLLYMENGRCEDCGNIGSDGKCQYYHNAVPINPSNYTCKHWEPRV